MIGVLVNRGDSNPAAIIDHYANSEGAQTIDRFDVVIVSAPLGEGFITTFVP